MSLRRVGAGAGVAPPVSTVTRAGVGEARDRGERQVAAASASAADGVAGDAAGEGGQADPLPFRIVEPVATQRPSLAGGCRVAEMSRRAVLVVVRAEHEVARLVVLARVPGALVGADVDEPVGAEVRDRRRDAEDADPVVLVDRVEVDVAVARRGDGARARAAPTQTLTPGSTLMCSALTVRFEFGTR